VVCVRWVELKIKKINWHRAAFRRFRLNPPMGRPLFFFIDSQRVARANAAWRACSWLPGQAVHSIINIYIITSEGTNIAGGWIQFSCNIIKTIGATYIS